MRKDKLREQILKNQRANRYLTKDSNERKVVEEVFDGATIRSLNVLRQKGELDYLNGVVAAGKEARVYWGVARDDSPLAVKIYFMASMEFKKRLRYIAGDRRFEKIPSNSRDLIRLWVQKEFKNLQIASEKGIRVPVPYALNANVLLMEYIGEPPAPAPIFAETEVDEDDYRWTMKTIRNLYRKAGLVHADLSEYNVFKTAKGERILFDMGSAVLTTHPESKAMLTRDVTNVARFFRKRGIDSRDPAELVEEIIS